MDIDTDQESDTQKLYQCYYDYLFPYNVFCRWLGYSNNNEDDYSSNLSRREFSFTLERGGSEIYSRFLTFKEATDLKEAMCKSLPKKIDIGAIYNFPVNQREGITTGIKTVERELVFDIDLTDYDNVRTCCTEANICEKCWKFCIVAAKLISRALTQFFGFRHIFLVFSGRRGIHMWVCDKKARELTDKQRQALLRFIVVHLGVKENSQECLTLKESIPMPPSPFFYESFKLCLDSFERYIVPENEQNLFQSFDDTPKGKERRNVFYQLFVDSNLVRQEQRQELDSILDSSSSGNEKWEQIKDRILKVGQNFKFLKDRIASSSSLYNIVFYYIYPRIDENVSIHQNHLLKSMFSIHPKTGKVCVPIPMKEIDSFDPLHVPTLYSLYKQFQNTDPNSTKDYIHQTDLGRYVDIFDQFVNSIDSN